MTKETLRNLIMETAGKLPNVLVVFNCGHVRVATLDRELGAVGAEVLLEKNFRSDLEACLSYLMKRD